MIHSRLLLLVFCASFLNSLAFVLSSLPGMSTPTATTPTWFLFSQSSDTTETDSTLPAKTRYEVCLSPGCIADGAEETLAQMEALAAVANIEVFAGKCCSLCGNGPILIENDSKKLRKVTESKLIDLLFPEDYERTPQQEKILQGFQLSTRGNNAMEEREFKEAADFYQQAMKVGFDAAIETQQGSTDLTDETSIPTSMKWVVRAQENLAQAFLELGDFQAAIEAATHASESSNGLSPMSFEILQKAYEATKDVAKELQALEALFALPEPSKMTTMQQNVRRTLGFRLAKLQREA